MKRECHESPTLTAVGPMIHVECVACGLDYYVPRAAS